MKNTMTIKIYKNVTPSEYEFVVTKDEDTCIRGYYVACGKKHYVTADRKLRYAYDGSIYEILEVRGQLSDVATIF